MEAMQDTLIISLIQKHLNDQCTEQELRTLLFWLKSSDDDALLDKVIKPFWDAIDQRMELPDERRVKELHGEVSLLLVNLKNRTNKGACQPKSLSVLCRVAAILVLALGITSGLLIFLKDSSPKLACTEYFSGKGQKKTVSLPDGTRIILNSATRLYVPSDFNLGERRVDMVGEGFFEVAHNPKKPFIVTSNNAQVRVLGTSFDFKSYAEDDFINVTVLTGKVRVNVADQDLQLSLSPNEHLSVNKADGYIRKEVIRENNHIKWIQNSLCFDKEPIRKVIKTIHRAYNRNILLQCKDCNYYLTGTHDNKSFDAVIEAICFTTGLHWRQKGDTTLIYDKL